MSIAATWASCSSTARATHLRVGLPSRRTVYSTVESCANRRPSPLPLLLSSAASSAVRVNDTRGYWQMPQGGIDAGEEPWPAALRELREETGVTDVELLAEVGCHCSQPAPSPVYIDASWVSPSCRSAKRLLYVSLFPPRSGAGLVRLRLPTGGSRQAAWRLG